jgi:F-type H+-transporting ATPase subunit delta
MGAVVDAMGLSALTRKTMGLLAQKRRLFALGDIIRDYFKLLAAHRGETTAEVTSARALTSDELEKLTATLKQVVGRDVAIEARVDADILGGLVVRIGSRMLDSSIRSKLQRLDIAMKGAG